MGLRRSREPVLSAAAVVVGRHLRVVQEREQLVAMFEQPPPDAQALRMLGVGLQQQIVEPMQDALPRLGKCLLAELVPILAQLDGVLEQCDERLDEGPYRLPWQLLTQLCQLAEQVDQTTLLGTIQAVVDGIETAD